MFRATSEPNTLTLSGLDLDLEPVFHGVDARRRSRHEFQSIVVTRFAAMLHAHCQGICSYAGHPVTTARVEAGNVAIGLIRKRARGLLIPATSN